MTHLIEKLNPMQQEAVKHTEGPLLILAGAGSGKTTVLVNRIAYMMYEKNVPQWNILAITFTNKAAKEMKDRISTLFDGEMRDMWVSTFHSACVRILRRDIAKLGYGSNFVIYDSADSQTVMKQCLKELELSDKNFPPRAILSQISNAKDAMQDADTFSKIHATDFRMSTVAKIYTLYQQKLRANNALDFDDIIVNAVKILSQNPDVLEYYHKKFKYILVDEYQDTNNAQYMLISLLAEKHRNLCVVGDDDQSIYKFRGANIRNILDFESEFPEARVIKLEQNYRSTQNILNASNAVIACNRGRKGKELWTQDGEGEKLLVYRAENEYDEGRYVAGEIDKLVKSGQKRYSDFAILYRTNAQSRVLEEMLLRQGVPHRILAGLRFYDRKEIKDLLAYLRLIHNPADSVSLKRIINEPKRGIGDVTVGKAEDIARLEGKSLFEVIFSASEYPELLRASIKLNTFAQCIMRLIEAQFKLDISGFISKVLEETGYTAALAMENTPEAETRIENIKEFLSVADAYEKNTETPSLSDFLEGISLISDIDNYDEDQEAVVLMTIHSAKGLEFDTVFVAGMEEGLFPGSRAVMDESEIEEERRLCYVALTRAKRNLYITHTFTRTLYGSTTYPRESRFLTEIPVEYTARFDSRKGKTLETKPKISAASSVASEIGKIAKAGKSGLFDAFDIRKNSTATVDFAAGDIVEHRKFGRGKVISTVPLGNDVKVVIEFEEAGTKNLMAMFANLKKVK